MNVQLNTRYDSKKDALDNLAELIISESKNHGEALEISYNLFNNLDSLSKGINESYDAVVKLYLVDRFRNMMAEDFRDYKAGDLFVIAEADVIMNEIRQEVYNRVEGGNDE